MHCTNERTGSRRRTANPDTSRVSKQLSLFRSHSFKRWSDSRPRSNKSVLLLQEVTGGHASTRPNDNTLRVSLQYSYLFLFFLSLRLQSAHPSTEHWEAECGKLKSITFLPSSLRENLDMIHSLVSSGCLAWCSPVRAWKQEVSGSFVVVGSRAAIPAGISIARGSDCRLANKRGFHQIPCAGRYCTISLPLYLQKLKWGRCYLSIAFMLLSPYFSHFDG